MQDYKLLYFKESDFKDQHGNTWCDVAFEGFSNTLKWVVKDPSKLEVGKEYYGEVTNEVAKSGNRYMRFRSKQREETPGASSGAAGGYSRDDAAIRAQWALGRASELVGTSDVKDRDVIVEWATWFFGMVDFVKEAKPVIGKEENKEAARDWKKLGKDEVEYVPDNKDDINLDDIPFN